MEASDSCVRCDYDLRGVADDQPCPECGLLAEQTRKRSDDLTDATPRWLGSIRLGVLLLLLAHVIAILWIPVFAMMGNALRPVFLGMKGTVPQWWFPSPFFSRNYDLIYLCGFDVAALLLLIGVWVVSRPQPNAATAHLDRRLCNLLRLAAFAPIFAMGLAHWLLFDQGYLGEFIMHWRQLSVLLLLTYGSAAVPVLLFILLRRLAQRWLHTRLAEHATIVAVGYAATLCAIPPLLWLLHLGNASGRREWDGGSVFAIIVWLLIIVSTILFGGWTALNCVRFAIAFRNARRGALRKWAAADRASPPIPSP